MLPPTAVFPATPVGPLLGVTPEEQLATRSAPLIKPNAIARKRMPRVLYNRWPGATGIDTVEPSKLGRPFNVRSLEVVARARAKCGSRKRSIVSLVGRRQAQHSTACAFSARPVQPRATFLPPAEATARGAGALSLSDNFARDAPIQRHAPEWQAPFLIRLRRSVPDGTFDVSPVGAVVSPKTRSPRPTAPPTDAVHDGTCARATTRTSPPLHDAPLAAASHD